MNPLETLIPSSVAEALGGTMMHSLWQLSAVAVVLMLALALVPRNAVRLRYRLAVAAMVTKVLLPAVTFALLYSPSEAVVDQPAPVAMKMTPAQFAAIRSTLAPAAQPASAFEAMQAFFQENAYLFLGLWMVGALLLSLRFVGGAWQVNRLRRRNLVAVPEELQAAFEKLKLRMGLGAEVKLGLSRAIDTPMAIGALKPLVLLPASLLSGLTPEQVECILIHELAHVRRWDYLVNMLQCLVEIVLFFHPATWWVTKVIRNERENCCDEQVLGQNSNKVQYARALLSLEVLRQQPQMAMAATGGELNRRIRRITGGSVPKDRRMHLRGFVYGLIALVCLVVVGTQSPNVVKAAWPFLAAEEDSLPADQGKKSATTLKAENKDDDDSKARQDAYRLAGLLGKIKIATTGLDSPITKIVIDNDGDQVEMTLGQNGQITSAKHNGKEVPADQLGEYQSIAEDIMAPGANVPPAADMPGMPPFPAIPSIGAMPPMPPMPAIPSIPFGDDGNFDSKAFEKQMEAFGKQMESWGQDFAKQFEGQEWSAFAENAAKWAEGMAGAGADPLDNPEGKRIRKEMEELERKMEKTTDPAELGRLGAELGELGAQLGEMGRMNGEEFEARMEAFGEQMEQWGERLADDLAHLQDLEGIDPDSPDSEDMREAEEDATEADREAEEDAREADREAARARREEMDEVRAADREAARADREVMEAEREAATAARAARGTDALRDALVRDGLINNPNSYKVKINEKELVVNGRKQSDSLHRKYVRLIEHSLGTDIGKDWITIQHNMR